MINLDTTEQEEFKTAVQSSKEAFENLCVETISAPKFSLFSMGDMQFNKIFDAIKPSTFGVLAAKTGVGKTTFALNLAMNAAQKSKVRFISLKMNEKQIVRKCLSLFFHVDYNTIEDIIKYNKKDFCATFLPDASSIKLRTIESSELQSAMNEPPFSNLDIAYLCNIPNLNWIYCEVQKAIDDGVKFIVIDYLQKVIHTNAQKSNTVLVAELCDKLQQLACKNNVAILGLSQVDQKVPVSGKPTVYNLKNSSVVGESADYLYTLSNVADLFITQKQDDYREELELHNIVLHLQKNRYGKNNQSLDLAFLGCVSKFFALKGDCYSWVQDLLNEYAMV